MKIQPIDVDKIHGARKILIDQDTNLPFYDTDNTEQSIKTLAEKINQIIEWINSKNDQLL